MLFTYLYIYRNEGHFSFHPDAAAGHKKRVEFVCGVFLQSNHPCHKQQNLTSPGPSEIGHNSFISQPILKPLRPVDSS